MNDAAHGPFKVGICGSYGGLNLGDEAILNSIIHQLRNALPVEITVFSRNAADTLARHRIERAVAVREMTQAEVQPEVERLDLFILGGGGILFDSELKAFLREAMLALEAGVPLMVYAVSAGPLKERASQQLVAEALNRAAVVTVRDRLSKRTLEEAGVTREVEVTADPALLLEGAPLPESALVQAHLESRRRQLVGMSVREPGGAAPELDETQYHGLLASAADYMIDRFDADVLLIPMERRVLDLQHSHAVVAQMLQPQRARVLSEELSEGQLLTLMRRLDFAVGMRLHFLIFAALQGVPFVALPYSPKVSGFLEELEIRMPPIHLVNAGRLIAHIDYYWDNREAQREQVGRLLPAIRQRALRNNELAVGLLRERALRRAA